MENEVSAGAATERFRPLSGPDLSDYSSALSRLVLAGRLNQLYPDPYGCSARLQFLSPAVRDGIYDGILLDRTSGIPQLKDVLTPEVDRKVAEDFLREEGARAAAGRAPTPKLAAKAAYYQQLLAVEIPPLCRLEVRLRRVFPDRNAASFQVVFDRYDSAEAVFVRYTVLLEETARGWGSPLLERTGDYTEQTSSFRQTMERFAQDDSEITFLLLGRVKGLRLEEVTRARIGPLWSPWSPAPAGWFPRDARGAYVLHLPLDKASVYQKEDLDNDPFSGLFKDSISDSSRSLVEEAAHELGYRVYKDRKFACTAPAAPVLQEKLREAASRNLVYVA